MQIKFLSAPGYYLYADRFSFEAEGQEVRVVDVQLPAGATKYEAIFNREVTYFRGLMVATLKHLMSIFNRIFWRLHTEASIWIW